MSKTIQEEVQAMHNALPEGYICSRNIMEDTITIEKPNKSSVVFTGAPKYVVSGAWKYVRTVRNVSEIEE